MRKRILSTLLALCMALTLLPGTAWASDPPETSGTLGDNLTWDFDKDSGTLTVNGTGDMPDFAWVIYGKEDEDLMQAWQFIVYYATYISEEYSIKHIVIQDGITSIGENMFAYIANLETVSIPDSVTVISQNAFYASGMPTITIPNSVHSIGQSAFWNCWNLESIVIPNSVTTLGRGAFESCDNLKSVILSDGLTYIDKDAFSVCPLLTEINIPSGVTSIGERAFAWDRGITSIIIPDSVVSIGSEAFRECDNLKDVYYTGSAEQWEKIEIANNPNASFGDNESILNATKHYNYGKTEEYPVTYDLSGGEGTVPETESYTPGTEVTVTSDIPTREGFLFDGWAFGAEVCQPGQTFVMPAQPVTLYARWTIETPKNCTVSYDLNGGAGTVPFTQTYAAGATVTVSSVVPTKAGAKFQGWSDGNRIYQAGEQFIAPEYDVVLTAQWKKEIPPTPDRPSTPTYPTSPGTSTQPSTTPSTTTPSTTTPDKPEEPSQPAKPEVPEKPSTPTPVSLPFADVRSADWFHSAVQYVYTKGLMTGETATAFSPNASMTRAMVWTVLGRLSGADVNGGAPWYANAQAWAVSASVSDGTDPDSSITREQLVTMLYRQAGSPTTQTDLSGFADSAAVSGWAAPAVQWAVSNGLLVGDGGRLNPAAAAVRSEVAVLLMRFCENITK